MHAARRAASRAACTAGSNSAIKIAMIAITTSNSTNVKPCRCLEATGFNLAGFVATPLALLGFQIKIMLGTAFADLGS